MTLLDFAILTVGKFKHKSSIIKQKNNKNHNKLTIIRGAPIFMSVPDCKMFYFNISWLHVHAAINLDDLSADIA
jgi:hypothetical protein